MNSVDPLTQWFLTFLSGRTPWYLIKFSHTPNQKWILFLLLLLLLLLSSSLRQLQKKVFSVSYKYSIKLASMSHTPRSMVSYPLGVRVPQVKNHCSLTRLPNANLYFYLCLKVNLLLCKINVNKIDFLKYKDHKCK